MVGTDCHQADLYLVGNAVFEVKTSRHDRIHAKRLDTATAKFVKDAGALAQLPLDVQPITVEQALDLGLRHGICIKDQPLTEHLSVRLGAGPTCRKTLFGVTQRQLLAELEARIVAVQTRLSRHPAATGWSWSRNPRSPHTRPMNGTN